MAVVGSREIVKEMELRTTPSPGSGEEMMCVALGKDVKESERNLMWALHNSRGMKICVLHIHLPAQTIPVLGTKVAISRLDENLVKAYREHERQEMHKIVDKYIQICERLGVRAEKLCKEMESIERGIVQLIYEYEIKWLVMGAAANKFYSRKMKEPRSNKAIHVCLEAPTFCQIWFTCKGNHIYTRATKLHGINIEVQRWRSCSLGEGVKGQMNLHIGSVLMKVATLGLTLLILVLLLCDGRLAVMKFSKSGMNLVMK